MWAQAHKGRVRLFERYKDASGSSFVLSCIVEKDTAQARRKAKAALDAKAAKRAAPRPDGMTFGQLAAAYNAYQASRWKPSTAKQDEMHSVRLVALIGPETPIRGLTSGQIRAALDKSGESPAWKNGKLRHLRQTVRWAYRQQIVESTDCVDRLDRWPEPSARQKAARKYLEKGELAALLASIDVPLYALVTKALVLTGMRIGELIALEARDVDFPSREIRITRTYQLNTGQVGSPKTFDSARTVHMTDEVEAVMRAALEASGGSRLAFPWGDGGFMHYDAYRAYMAPRMVRAAGRKLSVHALRHTYTALMAEAGIPIEVVSRQLGHHDSKTTRDIYLHVTQETQKKDAALLDAVRLGV